MHLGQQKEWFSEIFSNISQNSGFITRPREPALQELQLQQMQFYGFRKIFLGFFLEFFQNFLGSVHPGVILWSPQTKLYPAWPYVIWCVGSLSPTGFGSTDTTVTFVKCNIDYLSKVQVETQLIIKKEWVYSTGLKKSHFLTAFLGLLHEMLSAILGSNYGHDVREQKKPYLTFNIDSAHTWPIMVALFKFSTHFSPNTDPR